MFISKEKPYEAFEKSHEISGRISPDSYQEKNKKKKAFTTLSAFVFLWRRRFGNRTGITG
jgi:hypothetical protein